MLLVVFEAIFLNADGLDVFFDAFALVAALGFVVVFVVLGLACVVGIGAGLLLVEPNETVSAGNVDKLWGKKGAA